MIVDDHSRMRALLRQIVVAHDDEFVECRDGTEALAIYARTRPDWVLLDLSMPRLDGLSAATELTRNYPDARIIIVTQDDTPETREAAERAGAVAYVLKESVTD